MKWEVLYADWSIYNSDNYAWIDIPNTLVQKVSIIFDNGNSIVFSGVDVYCLEVIDADTFKLTYWKDEEPEGDPYFEMGRSRIIHSDETVTEDTWYVPMADFFSIPMNLRKRGSYVDIETAIKMGFLNG